ncbi:endonuclease MutS2 [Chitinophaga nivalis]|uniref:DNA mismatch repair protein MutS n=1 Tax=Chitinophaga nivalis TaxID=2991709 RepID=A0ABT3IQ70_9BACT|nr:MutS2/Smr-associated SH3 domain-containing protein [Chitinophaga nivalis]MCW3464374.1 DNA mismatch repair protein MutS [Chitinophaga nivalis]MCW3485935.1 DNA mismatch repair protein MutS [Chitinophaga nivalis]
MKYFPESALMQLEFDKVQALLQEHCKTDLGKEMAANLRLHTHIDYVKTALQQAHEYKQLTLLQENFPNDYILNLKKELRLLAIEGAVLTGEQAMLLRKLAESMHSIVRFFDHDRRTQYGGLFEVIKDTHYEKKITATIDEVLDELGQVRDNASPELAKIRMSLFRKRNELRRVFDRILQKLQKLNYLADQEEAFLNGRRVVAIYAENKRMVKGLILGESDTRKTAFLEPEETIELNNDVQALEREEGREVYRILKAMTASLSSYGHLLNGYHDILGTYDFIRGKAKLALDMDAHYPTLLPQAQLHLIQAYHPLLLLYNRKNKKPTIPVNINLDKDAHILVISGPNAGGKTVTLKTIGLIQLMLQSGLLVPVHPSSQLGIFKQLMIHIGDTQSLEFELSTYSSHLKNMKYFMENANGKTLFFIDELGSGSDPNLGGAFAEVIMEELAKKHAFGIVTTHYLNLKVMANKVKGIINGAMGFDEQTLLPMYKLMVGKPGSSYTFSIAERIGLNPALIARAKKLVDEGHFQLDKLLNKAEQDLQKVESKEKELQKLLKENERLKREYEILSDKEKKSQQITFMKLQNQIKETDLQYLKDMERKLKQIVGEWKRSDDKEKVMKQAEILLFRRREKQINEKIDRKVQEKFEEISGQCQVGDQVKIVTNRQVGKVIEIRDKRAIVQIGNIPINVKLSDLVLVQEKPKEAETEGRP